MKKTATKHNQATHALMLFLLIVFLAACSKKDDPTPSPPKETPTAKSAAKEISSIRISKSENAGISGDGYVFKSGTKIYITIPLNSALTNIKTNFNLSDKATITINGNILTNGIGTIDLTNSISAKVTAENGSSTNYTILAQLGIPDIDAMIYPFIEKYAIPSASYAIGKNSEEKIVYKSAAGFVNVESSERATPNHMFRLASMSKQHTAIAIMKLIEEGRIGIDDLVFGSTGILKSSFPTVGPMSGRVTVRHLLEHTGGYSGDPCFVSNQSVPKIIKTL
jgi:hypothetical protein